jgi:DNA-directed RNA polymerases I, II, and III subunit RPABC2
MSSRSDKDQVKTDKVQVQIQEVTRNEDNTFEIIDDPKETLSTRSLKSSEYMSKYEKARILGLRAMQISLNSQAMVPTNGETDPLRIALMELRARKLSMIIRRHLPDNTYEDWAVNDLIMPD